MSDNQNNKTSKINLESDLETSLNKNSLSNQTDFESSEFGKSKTDFVESAQVTDVSVDTATDPVQKETYVNNDAAFSEIKNKNDLNDTEKEALTSSKNQSRIVLIIAVSAIVLGLIAFLIGGQTSKNRQQNQVTNQQSSSSSQNTQNSSTIGTSSSVSNEKAELENFEKLNKTEKVENLLNDLNRNIDSLNPDLEFNQEDLSNDNLGIKE